MQAKDLIRCTDEPPFFMSWKARCRLLDNKLREFEPENFHVKEIDHEKIQASLLDDIEKECRVFFKEKKELIKKKNVVLSYRGMIDFQSVEIVNFFYKVYFDSSLCIGKKKKDFFSSCGDTFSCGDNLFEEISKISELHRVTNILSEYNVYVTEDFFKYRFVEIMIELLNSDIHFFKLEAA